jgi:hypothetical protein
MFDMFPNGVNASEANKIINNDLSRVTYRDTVIRVFSGIRVLTSDYMQHLQATSPKLSGEI